MRVLAMASQKGGSGKTTLSGHLAVQEQLSGAGPVCLIDIDPQGSLADGWNEREADMPAFAQTAVARLASDLEVLRQQGFRLAVIDTAPAITMAIQSVIAVAELIVIPTRPRDRKSTRLNSSHVEISYAVFCLKKKKKKRRQARTRIHH